MRAKRVLAGLILCLGVAAVFLWPVRLNTDLLSDANVVDTLDYNALHGTVDLLPEYDVQDDYAWVDDHRLIRNVWSTRPMNASELAHRGPGNPNHTSTLNYKHLMVKDITTGAMTPFMAPYEVGGGTLISVSPDGKWILWDTDPNLQGMPVVSSFDGRQFEAWQRPNSTFGMTWMPDSRRWIVASTSSKGNGCLTVASLGQKDVREIPLDGLSSNNGVAGFLSPDKVIVRDSFDPRFDPRQSQLYNEPPSYHIANFSDPNGGMSPLNVKVPAVSGAQDAAALVSPRGDRILWWFRVFHLGIIDQLKDKFLHSGTSSISVIVTDVNGSHCQNLGSIPESRHLMDSMPKWCPDGRHISFVDNLKLYRVDVPYSAGETRNPQPMPAEGITGSPIVLKPTSLARQSDTRNKPREQDQSRVVYDTKTHQYWYPIASSIVDTLPTPMNVTATAGDHVVNITWSAAKGANGYTVYRVRNGLYCAVGWLRSGETSFADTAIYNGDRYTYVVTASSGALNSKPSTPTATVTPHTPRKR